MKAHLVSAVTIAALLFGFTGVRGVRAQQRGPSTPEERSKAVKIAHDLEDDPLANDAKTRREWVIQWIVDIPDITVNVCFDYFGKLPDPPRGHSTEIARQMVISSAAFMIEHPEERKKYGAALKERVASKYSMDKMLWLVEGLYTVVSRQ